jgi:hypothetical protein
VRDDIAGLEGIGEVRRAQHRAGHHHPQQSGSSAD